MDQFFVPLWAKLERRIIRHIGAKVRKRESSLFVSQTNELCNLDWTRHQIWNGQPPRPIKVGNNCMHSFALTRKFFVVGEKCFGIPQTIGLTHLALPSHIVHPVRNESFLFGISQKNRRLHKEPYRDHLGHPKNKENFARSWKTYAGRFSESREGFRLGGFKLVVRSHILRKIWQIPWLGMSFKWGLWQKGGTFGAEQALGWVGVP